MRRLGILLGLGLLTALPCSAGQVPAWLDDAITARNKKTPENPIQYIGEKDSYVWYSMSNTPPQDPKVIRERVHAIAIDNKYATTQDEEIVTKATPPAPSGMAKARKCWTRSYLRDMQSASATTVQRMLTTMVCEGDQSWYAGFRILQ